MTAPTSTRPPNTEAEPAPAGWGRPRAWTLAAGAAGWVLMIRHLVAA